MARGMEGAEREAEGAGKSAQRARLAVAFGATLLLALIIGVVLATRGSDEGSTPTGACFVAWNEDAVAPRQDGIHAYNSHGYRQALVARIDREGQVIEGADDELEPDDPDARCAIIFAAPQVDNEPDFGVRVFDRGAWTGLVLDDGTQLEDIAALQAEAVATSNATLSSNGTLAED